MSDLKTTPALTARRNPPCAAAVNMAAAYAGRTFCDEAEAMLALEVAFEDAIQFGAQNADTLTRRSVQHPDSYVVSNR